MRIGSTKGIHKTIMGAHDYCPHDHPTTMRCISTVLEQDGIEGTIEQTWLNCISVLTKRFVSHVDYEEEFCCNSSVIKLQFVLEGSYCFCLTDNKEILEIPKGHYNLVSWSRTKGIHKISSGESCSLSILISHDFLKNLLGESATSKIGKFIYTSQKRPNCIWQENERISPKLMAPIQEILKCPYEGDAKAAYIGAKVHLILVDLFLGQAAQQNIDSKKTSLSKSESDAMRKVEEHIRKNLKKRLTIKDLTPIAGLNTTTLKNNFKKEFGTTIFKHITQLRMAKASSLILDKHFSIAQAAYEVGYSNPQHFTVAFKKTIGYLPSKLKENSL